MTDVSPNFQNVIWGERKKKEGHMHVFPNSENNSVMQYSD